MIGLARPGPSPKPDILKAMEGNPGKRKLNLDAKQPEGMPNCPVKLCQAAKNEWRRVAKDLHELGLLSRVDRAALAVYCDAYTKWLQATEMIDQYGLTMEYENKAGAVNVVARPEVAIANKYSLVLKSFCAEFGLTPSSRCRLVLPKDKEVDEFEEDFK